MADRDASFQTSSVAEMYRNLADSEVMAASNRPTPRNRLRPSALVDLLDERKALASRFELDRLAERYNVDVDVMERLALYVNTPSVTEAGTHTSKTDENEGETTKMLVRGPPLAPRLLLTTPGPLGGTQVPK